MAHLFEVQQSFTGIPGLGTGVKLFAVQSGYAFPYGDPNAVGALYLNKCWHVAGGYWVYWTTDYVDYGGQVYPGPGIFGVDTNNYRVGAKRFVVPN